MAAICSPPHAYRIGVIEPKKRNPAIDVEDGNLYWAVHSCAMNDGARDIPAFKKGHKLVRDAK